MVTPLAPGISGLERWTTLSTFLNSLADALDARLAGYLPIGPDTSLTRSHPARSVDAGELRALERIARDWASEDPPQTVRLGVPGLGVVDLAAVRGAAGDTRGALVVVRSATQHTDRATATAEMELAASLAPAVLGSSFLETARQALLDWASAQDGRRTAFAISIDRLGAANEVLGYRAGDKVLRSMVGRIEFWAGRFGRVARVGGTRYLVVRTDLVDETAALREVERLRELIAEPVSVEGLAISRSASIGVACDPDRTLSADALLWGATRAGAAARANGGDTVRVYNEHTAAGRLSRLQLDLELAEALSSGALRIHYQPEFDLDTGAVVAVEALLRWQHPTRGLLGADVFVPESEQTRTFVAVQHWVIDTTCRQLAQWRAHGLADGLTLRVNVPAPQVLHGGVTDVLFRALDRHRLPASQVCIELTERRMPAEVEVLAAELTRWRERGLAIAVDDFGTGEGTLSHLQLLPIDLLKLDQRFVTPMVSDSRAAAIVAGVMGLATSLRLDVVAEGVSGPDVCSALVALGCRRGQGNGLAEAMAPERLETLLARQLVPHSGVG